MPVWLWSWNQANTALVTSKPWRPYVRARLNWSSLPTTPHTWGKNSHETTEKYCFSDVSCKLWWNHMESKVPLTEKYVSIFASLTRNIWSSLEWHIWDTWTSWRNVLLIRNGNTRPLESVFLNCFPPSSENLKSSITLCWPRPVSITTTATTSNWELPAVNTSVCVLSQSQTLEILTSSEHCQKHKVEPLKLLKFPFFCTEFVR